MLKNTNTSLSNLVILATLSSSVVNLSHDSESYLEPIHEANFKNHFDIVDWKDSAFNQSGAYSIDNKSDEKMGEIISFTKKVLNNSKDIESEFVDIVNDNFWDLI